MIICAAPNTAVDRTLIVSDFRPGDVFRAADVLNAAGGKGVNVARAGRTLGADTLCMGLLGGSNGRIVAELAEKEGLRSAWTWIEGETRSCHIIVDPKAHHATVINEPGPKVSTEEWAHFQADVVRQASAADCVCYSGSLPPGVPPERLGELVSALCQATDCDLWIDTSGLALQAAVELGTHRFPGRINIKINDEEAAAVLGKTIAGLDAAAEAARELHSRGIHTAVLTAGSSGAALAGPAGVWRAEPPTLEVTSPVGSGDTFLAGLVTALNAGIAPAEALCRAVAAGTANALCVGGGRFLDSDFRMVLDQTTVMPVHFAR